MENHRRLSLFIAVVLTALLTPLGGVSLWVMVFGVTVRGRWLALIGLLIFVLPIMLALRYRTLLRGLLVATLLLSVVYLLTTPTGQPRPNSPVRHAYSHPDSHYPLLSLPAVVPEAEQINVGFWLAAIADPIFDWEQFAAVRQPTFSMYREMEADPNFYALGTSMNYSYRDVIGFPFDEGHYVLYRPVDAEGPLPVIVFLHGAGGPFKVYTWFFAQIAEETNSVLIVPTWGFGDWWQEGAEESVLAAIDHAATVTEIDREQVTIIGLSNGGAGALRTAAMAPDQFARLGLFSPVFDDVVLGDEAFAEAWAGKPTLIITGETDRRVPYGYVQERNTRLNAAGVTTQFEVYGGDHFIVFLERESITDVIVAWLLTTD